MMDYELPDNDQLKFMSNKAIKLEQPLIRQEKEISYLLQVIKEVMVAMDDSADATAYRILKSTINKEKLKSLVKKMRVIAARVGPLHAWWDVIIDIECFIEGRPTILSKTEEEWILYAEELLVKGNFSG